MPQALASSSLPFKLAMPASYYAYSAAVALLLALHLCAIALLLLLLLLHVILLLLLLLFLHVAQTLLAIDKHLALPSYSHAPGTSLILHGPHAADAHRLLLLFQSDNDLMVDCYVVFFTPQRAAAAVRSPGNEAV